MSYTNYLKLKNKGDSGELRFAEYLTKQGYTDIQHVDDIMIKDPTVQRSDFDLRAANSLGIVVDFEVKTQDDCDHWGTFNVEQVQNGKPGGIAVSKADIYVFVNENLGFGFIEASELKNIHWKIVKDPTVTKQSYKDKIKRGDVQLWITKFKNFAAGYRLPNERLTWYK